MPPIQGQYELISLEDANDYAHFLVEFTSDYQWFAMIIPDCGKPIIRAKLTPKKIAYEENQADTFSFSYSIMIRRLILISD